MVLSLNKVSIVSTRIQTVEEIIPTLINSQGDVYPSISGLYINDRKKYFEALSKININHLYLMFSGITGKEMENLVLSVKAKYIDLRHNVTSDILKSATLNPNIEILDIRGYEVTEADSTAIAQSNIKALLLSSMPSDNAVMNLLQSKHLKSLNIEFYLYIPNFVYSQPPYIINSDFTISNIELGKLIEIPNKQLQEFIKTLEGNTILTTLNLGTVQSNDFETILTPSLSVHDGIKADEEKQLAKILHRNKKLEEIVSFIKEISDRNETPFDLAKEDRIKIKETLLTIQQFLANPSTILQNHLKTIGYSADEIKIIKCHIHNFINEEFWKITGIVQYGLSNDINTNEAQKTTISDLPELALHKITSYLSLTDIVESTNNSIIIETANHFDD